MLALPPAASRPLQRVLYLIWREPWMSVAPQTYIAQMLALFNWQTLPAAPVERYPTITLSEFAGRVDRVLLSSEPYRRLVPHGIAPAVWAASYLERPEAHPQH